MAGKDFFELRNLNASSQARTVIDDTAVAFRLKYIGTGTVTTVTVDTNQDITLTTSDGGAEEFLLATYTTMGTLVDAINGSAYWECVLLDALRADSTASSVFVDDADVTISSKGYYDALIDTSVAKAMTYRVTYDRYPDTEKPSGSHRVKLQEIVYNLDINAASANGFRVYEWDALDKTETQIYRLASVDATETTVNFASGEGYITAGDGNDLIVRVIDATSLTDAAGNFLSCVFTRE